MVINEPTLREENYQEFLRLQYNPDYFDVLLDEQSGGVSAVHIKHKFDKQIGAYGFRRGDYEIAAMTALRAQGFRVTLESERSAEGIKICDGFLNDIPMDIKAIEGHGKWSVATKLFETQKQKASIVVLFFPNPSLFSSARIIDGIQKYCSSVTLDDELSVVAVLSVVMSEIRLFLIKETTPSAKWFSFLKVLGDRAGVPSTIPPSMQR